MLIINKYLSREIFTTLVGVTTVIFLIFISGQLASLFAKAASGALPVNTIMTLLGLKSLSNLVIVLPLAFYLSILLAFSRLYRDNEIAVLSACGIGQFSLLRPVFTLAFFFAVFVSVLSLYIAPWAQDKSRELFKKGEATSDIQALTAGRFKETPGGGGVIYVEETDNDAGKLRNVFIQRKANGDQSLISAASGYQYVDAETGSRFLVLERGYRYDGQPGEDGYIVVQFQKHGIRLVDKELLDSSRRQKEIQTRDLWKSWLKDRNNQEQLTKRYSTVNRSMAELQWRISSALLCIVLAVAAVPLSKTSARQGRYTKLALALMIYIIYTNLLNLSRVWVEQGKIHYAAGLWWVHLVILVTSIMFFIRPGAIKKLFLTSKAT